MHEHTKECWDLIIKKLKLKNYNFKKPFFVDHKRIKEIVSSLTHIANNKKEIRNLGFITKRENKPDFFKKKKLFLLPSSNKEWVILKGDGYFDPSYLVKQKPKVIKKKFHLDTIYGESEGRYIHQIYAQGILNDFTGVKNSVFTLSGRKYASFDYEAYGQNLSCNGVQIEIDAGYESEKEVILIEAKTGEVGSEITRQLFFPFKYVSNLTNKKIRTIFMVTSNDRRFVSLFEYTFKNPNHYESLDLVSSQKYKI
jgi:hypothetical protein